MTEPYDSPTARGAFSALLAQDAAERVPTEHEATSQSIDSKMSASEVMHSSWATLTYCVSDYPTIIVS